MKVLTIEECSVGVKINKYTKMFCYDSDKSHVHLGSKHQHKYKETMKNVIKRVNHFQTYNHNQAHHLLLHYLDYFKSDTMSGEPRGTSSYSTTS